MICVDLTKLIRPISHDLKTCILILFSSSVLDLFDVHCVAWMIHSAGVVIVSSLCFSCKKARITDVNSNLENVVIVIV
jgi:hypothetical protein